MAAGGGTVLDAMLEATLTGSGEAARPPRARGFAKSASPRPQRVRPVDTVRMAKSELAQMDGQAPPFSSKSRLNAPGGGGSGGEQAGLHDGFYDFAAAVVRPQPNPRQYAQQLRAQLVEQLKEIQTFGVGEGAAPDAGIHSGTLVATQRAQREIEVCMETLESFVLDTTTDSKEREALLQHARRSATTSLRKLSSLMTACCANLDDAEQTKAGLEESLKQIDEDNSGLRHVIQQMLVTEGDLRSQANDLAQEVDSLKEKLEVADLTTQKLTSQLATAVQELQDLQDEQSRGRPTTDQCCSPMMGFAAFMMSTDQVPNPNSDSNTPEGLPSWVKPESIATLGGLQPKEKEIDKNPRRKTVQQTPLLPGAQSARTHRLSARHSVVPSGGEATDARCSTKASEASSKARGSRHGSRSGVSSPVQPEVTSRDLSGGAGVDQELANNGRSSRSETVITMGGAAGGAAGTQNQSRAIEQLDFSTSGDQGKEVGDQGSRKSSLTTPPDDVLEAPLLASSFPALIPFVDFHMLDPELSKAQTDALALNSEHLEKHLVMLQEDYQKEVAQTEELQHSVDTCLERILVWVQAVHDSLQDLNSKAVLQDVKALTTLRNAVEWLAKHPCKEWTADSGHLEEVLEEHEQELRGHLAVDRQTDAEVEDLRKSIVIQRQRVQDLSDQLLEARSSVGGTVRPQRRAAPPTTTRRVSALQNTSAESSVQHTATQCEILCPETASAFITEAGDGRSSSSSAHDSATRGRATANSSRAAADSSRAATDREEEAADRLTSPEIRQPSNELSSGAHDNGALSIANDSPLPVAVSPGPAESRTVPAAVQSTQAQSDPADEAAGGPPAADKEPCLPKGKAAVEVAAHGAKRMLLLRSPFVEAIDFTAVPMATKILREKGEDVQSPLMGAKNDDKLLGLKQVRILIADVYIQKKADDLRRDKVWQPRKPVYEILQEHIRRHHGVKKVVHQKAWQLVESLNQYASVDKTVSMFTDFLDGSRDTDELSFYLYCTSALAIGVPEASQALPPARLPESYVGFNRAEAVIDLLFGDLPKALVVMKAELDKVSVTDEYAQQIAQEHLVEQVQQGVLMSKESFMESAANTAHCVLVDDLYEIMLEGWRMSALLLDQSIEGFSWRSSLRAFMQVDLCHRGWLDPHEVREAEHRRLQLEANASGDLPLEDRTSLGAFVFRCVHRCSNITRPPAGAETVQPPAAAAGAGRPKGAAEKRLLAKRKVAEHSLHVSSSTFESIKKTLEVFLTWMMHSDELRDLSVYRSVKAQIYSFQKALSAGKAAPGVHHLRSLLLLLLAHQFDVQYQQEDMSPEHLDWEMRSLLRLLRESWKRGASGGAGPEFGRELDELGDATPGETRLALA